MSTLPADLNALTVPERLQLIEDLWESLSEAQEVMPIPESLLPELERRKAALKADPDSGISLEELVQRVRARHGR